MLILGDRDQFSSLSSLHKMFKTHEQTAGLQEKPIANSILPYPHMETMADCDHFFASHRSLLAQKILHFCVSAHDEAEQRCESQNSSAGL